MVLEEVGLEDVLEVLVGVGIDAIALTYLSQPQLTMMGFTLLGETKWPSEESKTSWTK